MSCKNKSFLIKRKAFTLIELLIVIAIIGILFIVLISKVDFATDKAKATGVQTDFRSFQVAFETVAKENAGLSTFGWDTGDANGNRIRDSYDKGDTNQNGKQDPGEVFIGSKTYGETWTNVYTLTNPADDTDKSAIIALEEAINKNLDPKLHITIHDDLTITMANGAQDPWNTEYHGYYITNATTDGKDRGAIVIYSNGANQEFGSEHSIAGGVVTVNVPGNNVYGKDDYGMSVVYTYVNGYGEIKTTTSGFSVNQGGDQAGTNGSDINNTNTYNPEEFLPIPDDNPDLNDYTWEEINALALSNFSKEELWDIYGVEPGCMKLENGLEYTLVDVDGNDYGGFVFMVISGVVAPFGSSATSYADSPLREQVENIYNTYSQELQQVIKEVTVVTNKATTDNVVMFRAKLFLASATELGLTTYANTEEYKTYHDILNLTGSLFDYFTSSSRVKYVMSGQKTITRSLAFDTQYIWSVDTNGNGRRGNTTDSVRVFPAFVVGNDSSNQHTCSFTQQMATSIYLRTAATCKEAATYFYSCSCGMSSSNYFTYGIPNGHLDDNGDDVCGLCIDLNDWSWAQINAFANMNLTAEEYYIHWGINAGDYKEDAGYKFYLVDIDGNNYDGFVFMYDSKQSAVMHNYNSNNGGYANAQLSNKVSNMIVQLPSQLQSVIKTVTINCNDGKQNKTKLHTLETQLFLASYREVGGYYSDPSRVDEEGTKFDYLISDTNRNKICDGAWWTRSANANGDISYWYVSYIGSAFDSFGANYELVGSERQEALLSIVPTFVVGTDGAGNISCSHTNTEYVYISDGNGRTHSMDLKCLDCTYYEEDVNGEFCGELICHLCGSYCRHDFSDTIVENRCVFCGTMKYYDEPVLDNYTWAEIKTIAQKNLNSHDLLDQYGIALGNTKTENGVTYKLVDLDGNAYDGFVFIYDTGVSMSIQPMTNITTDGGYAESDFADNVNALYNNFSNELKNAIKEVTIKCSNNETYGWLLFDYTAKVFVPSLRESGSNSRAGDVTANEAFENEGQFFDYFNDSMTSMQHTSQRAKIYSGGKWWLRSVDHMFDSVYHAVSANGSDAAEHVTSSNRVVACFVIG